MLSRIDFQVNRATAFIIPRNLWYMRAIFRTFGNTCIYMECLKISKMSRWQVYTPG